MRITSMPLLAILCYKIVADIQSDGRGTKAQGYHSLTKKVRVVLSAISYNSQLDEQIHEQIKNNMKLILQRNNSYTVEIKSDDGEKVRLKYFRLGEGLIPDYDRFILPYGCSPLRVDADARQLIKPMWRRYNN